MAKQNHNWMFRVLANKEDIPSVKRLSGFVGWIVCQIVMIAVACAAIIFKTLDLDILEDMFTTDAWVSAALMGVECITGTFTRNTNRNIGQKEKETDCNEYTDNRQCPE